MDIVSNLPYPIHSCFCCCCDTLNSMITVGSSQIVPYFAGSYKNRFIPSHGHRMNYPAATGDGSQWLTHRIIIRHVSHRGEGSGGAFVGSGSRWLKTQNQPSGISHWGRSSVAESANTGYAFYQIKKSFPLCFASPSFPLQQEPLLPTVMTKSFCSPCVFKPFWHNIMHGCLQSPAGIRLAGGCCQAASGRNEQSGSGCGCSHR